jgi:hypothetical protein
MAPLMQRFFKSLWPAAILLLLVGCGLQPMQIEVEDEAAASIFPKVNLYLVDTNTSITNIAQIYAEVNLASDHRSHPWRFQKKFQRFGKYAGFKNSFYEKYVFLPRGTTSSIVGGEIVFLNAQPFPTTTPSARENLGGSSSTTSEGIVASELSTGSLNNKSKRFSASCEFRYPLL